MSIKANITKHNIEEKNIDRDKHFRCRQITKKFDGRTYPIKGTFRHKTESKTFVLIPNE